MGGRDSYTLGKEDKGCEGKGQMVMGGVKLPFDAYYLGVMGDLLLNL